MSETLDCKVPVLQKGAHLITSDYGNRSYTLNGKKVSDFHKGVDLVGGGHTTDFIIAFAAGKVTISKYSSSAGNYVQIDHGNGYKTRYLHMKDSPVVKVGQTVQKGQVLGYMGSTGNSTGAHLHFDIALSGEYLDPKPYLKGEKTIGAAAAAATNRVKAFQDAAIADGFSFPKYGADGKWGNETAGVAKKAIVKKRTSYKYKNLTRIVQTEVGTDVDGLCGTKTDAAIRAWQKKNGLAVDGAFGVNCWKTYFSV